MWLAGWCGLTSRRDRAWVRLVRSNPVGFGRRLRRTALAAAAVGGGRPWREKCFSTLFWLTGVRLNSIRLERCTIQRRQFNDRTTSLKRESSGVYLS
ncbi:hypothetical protein HPP92_018853 [Vanilla planifolia]|uniref:Uncharacterized protein n=1 Tax=Vanilla planifolia TaxID=51239 RepID=A0A835UMS9_VANPL|nr:hypothetical protein HPP92_018853 [Vanilla planifolia]